MPTPGIHFLFEHDGEGERHLKTKLSEIFDRHGAVTSAYLVGAEYEGSADYNVVLCLDADESVSLVKQVQEAFASLFSGGNHLDILFVNADQETSVKKVCEPFYKAG